jgi:hypothetical protein
MDSADNPKIVETMDANLPEEFVKVRVQTLSGREVEIEALLSSTLQGFKASLCPKLFLARRQVKLMLGADMLESKSKLLSELGITDGTVLTLCIVPLSDEQISLIYRNVGAVWTNRSEGKLELDRGMLARCSEEQRAEFLAGATADSHVRWLYLSNNNLCDSDAGMIAEALKRSNTLETLVLRFNDIGDEGARLLAEGIVKSSCLRELKLTSNQIGDFGACALAEAMEGSSTLEMLNLEQNRRITSVGRDRLIVAQEKIRASGRRTIINV